MMHAKNFSTSEQSDKNFTTVQEEASQQYSSNSSPEPSMKAKVKYASPTGNNDATPTFAVEHDANESGDLLADENHKVSSHEN